jgi:hypothetical protein
MHGVIPPLPQYVFMAWRLVKHRDTFTFTSTFNKYFYVDEIEGDEMGRECSMNGREMLTKVSLENFKVRYGFGELGRGERILLEWIIKKQSMDWFQLAQDRDQ